MIEFDNLSFWYKDNDSPSLSDINISIDEGEFVLVTGPSGCGKSTFIRSINGLIPHFYGGKIKGDVTVSGKKVSETPTNILSEKVGMVFQDPENQLITNEVEREIAFALENLCFSPDLIAKRIEEAIEAVGVSRIRHENPSNLSGGQKQKVAIASALAVHPEILLLDEPTSELDPAAAESILNIIEKINDELGITVILIEHRLERVVHHVDRMLILQDSKIIFDDNPRKINYNERKNWRIGLPPVTELSLRFADKLNNHELPLTVKEARTTLKELLSSMNNIIDLPEEKSLGREILSMKNVYFSYDGANDILKNINLSLREGDQLSIMGKNASGKTTLIKLINGILKQRKGSISLYGKKIEDYSSSEIIKRVGIVFQDPNLHLFNETVEEEIGFVLKNLGQDADTIETKVTQIMDEFGIS
ncbi:MAG: ATP-binding cassette domain-containing protein, partial [Bacteroidales bacterium]|nr:ATP-binding cassette domain-containing protein [Bacteroidales bacterium]